jgi:hypothetical protein
MCDVTSSALDMSSNTTLYRVFRTATALCLRVNGTSVHREDAMRLLTCFPGFVLNSKTHAVRALPFLWSVQFGPASVDRYVDLSAVLGGDPASGASRTQALAVGLTSVLPGEDATRLSTREEVGYRLKTAHLVRSVLLGTPAPVPTIPGWTPTGVTPSATPRTSITQPATLTVTVHVVSQRASTSLIVLRMAAGQVEYTPGMESPLTGALLPAGACSVWLCLTVQTSSGAVLEAREVLYTDTLCTVSMRTWRDGDADIRYMDMGAAEPVSTQGELRLGFGSFRAV